MLEPGGLPVVVPPRAPGFPAIIEGSNGTGPAKLGARFVHVDLSDREGPSSRFVAAHRRHRADRIESAPRGRAFPEGWKWNLQARPGGRIVSIRRTDTSGVVERRNRRFEVDRQWLNRLVRAEGDLDGAGVRFYRLRRGSPPTSPCSSR